MAKNTICLWYDKDAEAAARFYAATFPDSAVGAIRRAPRVVAPGEHIRPGPHAIFRACSDNNLDLWPAN